MSDKVDRENERHGSKGAPKFTTPFPISDQITYRALLVILWQLGSSLVSQPVSRGWERQNAVNRNIERDTSEQKSVTFSMSKIPYGVMIWKNTLPRV